MSSYVQMVTTTAKQEDAERIAQALVERRLAACVQIVGPVTSVYRWQEKIETAQEWQCHIKSRGEHFATIEAAIRSLHPYEVPEIIALPIHAGSAPYLAWIDAEVLTPPRPL
jgi:periplasmic divalent cation tolerance protein